MTWTVPWNGKEYDVDPTEFTGLELSRIKQRASLTYRQLVHEIGQFDGEAIRAVFWTVDVRDDPNLKFSEYGGPPLSVIFPHMDAFNDAMAAAGKALGMPDPDETSETSGGPSSASSTEAPSPTETSTTG